MSDMYQSLSHSKWDCKYHVVFIPKCRRKALYGQIRKHLGAIFHELARQKECQIVEGHLMPDHVHICIAIPPKFAVSSIVGKGEERAADTERHAACEALPAKLPRVKSQQQEFLDAVRDGARPYSAVDSVAPLMEGVLLGCVAQRVAGRLAWSSRKGRITNNPEANGLVAPVLRSGWSFPK